MQILTSLSVSRDLHWQTTRFPGNPKRVFLHSYPMTRVRYIWHVWTYLTSQDELKLPKAAWLILFWYRKMHFKQRLNELLEYCLWYSEKLELKNVKKTHTFPKRINSIVLLEIIWVGSDTFKKCFKNMFFDLCD